MGHDPDVETSPPWDAALVAGLPATLVLIAPGIAAFAIGRYARRLGVDAGGPPAAVGALIAGFLVVVSVVAGVFGR